MRIAVDFFLFFGTLAASSTITEEPSSIKVSKPTDSAFLKSEAAEVDMRFFSVFLLDFRDNEDSYTSYLGDRHKTMPQKVADYYNHVAQLPPSADLERDIAASFPFSQFQTFIAEFPWYSTLLSKAHASTMFIPEDFVTKGVSQASKSASVQLQSSSKSASSPTSTKSHTHNGAVKEVGSSSCCLLQFFIPILVGILL